LVVALRVVRIPLSSPHSRTASALKSTRRNRKHRVCQSEICRGGSGSAGALAVVGVHSYPGLSTVPSSGIHNLIHRHERRQPTGRRVPPPSQADTPCGRTKLPKDDRDRSRGRPARREETRHAMNRLRALSRISEGPSIRPLRSDCRARTFHVKQRVTRKAPCLRASSVAPRAAVTGASYPQTTTRIYTYLSTAISTPGQPTKSAPQILSERADATRENRESSTQVLPELPRPSHKVHLPSTKGKATSKKFSAVNPERAQCRVAENSRACAYIGPPSHLSPSPVLACDPC
jgi:hypothetical protein